MTDSFELGEIIRMHIPHIYSNSSNGQNHLVLRITFEYKGKIGADKPMIGYVVKIIPTQTDMIFNVLYRSEYWETSNVNVNFLMLDVAEKRNKNTIEELEKCIIEANDFWYVDIKKMLNDDCTMGKYIFSTNPQNQKFI